MKRDLGPCPSCPSPGPQRFGNACASDAHCKSLHDVDYTLYIYIYNTSVNAHVRVRYGAFGFDVAIGGNEERKKCRKKEM